MDVNELKSKLSDDGILVSSIKELVSKGLMSKIFIAESNKGKIIIHVSSLVDEQKYQHRDEKIYLVGKILEKYPDIPSAKVLSYGKLQNNLSYMVQSAMDGKPLGERVIKNGKIMDVFSDKKYLTDALKILAQIHTIHTEGFGYIDTSTKKLNGKYTSWKQFLQTESSRWITVLEKNSSADDKTFLKDLRVFISELLEKYSLDVSSSRLIHGDMVNPGNILVSGKKITGIIDFEWALVGDPAWEFAFTNTVPLKEYFDERKKFEQIDEKEFLLRVKIYNIFWLLWGANVHAKNSSVKDILFDMLKDRVKKFN